MSLTRWHHTRPRHGHRHSSTSTLTAPVWPPERESGAVEVEPELRASWTLDLGTSRAADGVLDDLLTRHREAHRRYHTLSHVAHVLRAVAELLPEVEVPDPVAVRLAAWFHDAIYDPRSTVNEADSAALAERL